MGGKELRSGGRGYLGKVRWLRCIIDSMFGVLAVFPGNGLVYRILHQVGGLLVVAKDAICEGDYLCRSWTGASDPWLVVCAHFFR